MGVISIANLEKDTLVSLQSNSLGVGIYRITQIDGYIDLNYPAFNGYVISLVTSGIGSQIFYFGDDSVVYYRHKWNIWTPWKKISFNP